MSRRRLAVLTTGRQDWGLLKPLCEKLSQSPAFEPLILAGGMACSPAYGRIVDAIRQASLPVSAELPWDLDAPAELQVGCAVESVARTLRQLEPEAIVLLGDRFETAAAALAATLLAVPIVHLHGGEETEGAIDNALRHAITKLSHLHLVAHPAYARRVLQMGEDPGTIHVVGSLAVDNMVGRPLRQRAWLEADLGVRLDAPVGLVTVHPTTLATRQRADEVDAVIGAMEQVDATWIVTLPNADPGNAPIRERLLDIAGRRPGVHAFQSLGEERYLALMALSFVVLGNSSSGVIEAPSLRVPSVNVGDRQKGRLRFPSIIDVPPDIPAIVEALSRVREEAFLSEVSGMSLPFGDGHASNRILEHLLQWCPPSPPRKRFKDVPCNPPTYLEGPPR